MFHLIIVSSLIFIPTVLQACPGCSEAINSALGRGFNTSILFMMAMPFTIVGAIGLGIAMMYRHQKKRIESNQKRVASTS